MRPLEPEWMPPQLCHLRRPLTATCLVVNCKNVRMGIPPEEFIHASDSKMTKMMKMMKMMKMTKMAKMTKIDEACMT